MWIHRDVLPPRAIEIGKCVMRPIIGELKFVSRIESALGYRLINKNYDRSKNIRFDYEMFLDHFLA